MWALKLCTNKMLHLMHVDLYNGCKMVVVLLSLLVFVTCYIGMLVLCGILKKYADRINTKYAAEI